MCKSNCINRVRKDSGMSIKELSLKLDMPTSTVEKYLYNKAQPDIFDIQKIAEIFGVESKELINEQ